MSVTNCKDNGSMNSNNTKRIMHNEEMNVQTGFNILQNATNSKHIATKHLKYN